MNSPFRVALTMRVVETQDYRETRDTISHEWIDLFRRRHWLPLLVPNGLSDPAQFLDQGSADALILTGGGDIGPVNGEQEGVVPGPSMRDTTERCLLDRCIATGRPVLGVCRGMQMINVFCGGGIVRSLRVCPGVEEGHVGRNHEVRLNHPFLRGLAGSEVVTTNSYHNQGVTLDVLAPDLIAAAQAGPVVEAVIHRRLPIVGIQWHLERENPASFLDESLMDVFAAGSRFGAAT